MAGTQKKSTRNLKNNMTVRTEGNESQCEDGCEFNHKDPNVFQPFNDKRYFAHSWREDRSSKGNKNVSETCLDCGLCFIGHF